jgi:hypothetical protein
MTRRGLVTAERYTAVRFLRCAALTTVDAVLNASPDIAHNEQGSHPILLGVKRPGSWCRRDHWSKAVLGLTDLRRPCQAAGIDAERS